MQKLAVLAAAALSLGCAKHVIDIDVRVIIPADVPTIASGELRLSLWEYDPRIADVSATLVGRQTGRFTHRVGERNEFQMRVSGAVADRYYITLRGFRLTSQGEEYVLWGDTHAAGAPSVVTMKLVQFATTSLPPDEIR